jgi:FMN phosphatase YigB (HAD superfamily)
MFEFNCLTSKKLISFDLRGTLSSKAISQELWQDLIPSFYAQKYNLNLSAAKEYLNFEFRTKGAHHELFHDYRLRLNSLLDTWNFDDIVKKLKYKPDLDHSVLSVIEKIPSTIPVVLISATTRDFIEYELGPYQRLFKYRFSAIDDFATSGKPPQLYQRISSSLEVKPDHCLHVGDCKDMDFKNAIQAGWNSFHFDKQKPRGIVISELTRAIHQFVSF